MNMSDFENVGQSSPDICPWNGCIAVICQTFHCSWRNVSQVQPTFHVCIFYIFIIMHSYWIWMAFNVCIWCGHGLVRSYVGSILVTFLLYFSAMLLEMPQRIRNAAGRMWRWKIIISIKVCLLLAAGREHQSIIKCGGVLQAGILLWVTA
jgi:hypothetical protein